MSHREFLIHADWLLREWNKPSRSDYYLMKIMQVVIEILSKRGAKIPEYEELRVKFGEAVSPLSGEGTGETKVVDPEHLKRVSEVARASHLRGNTANVTYKTRPKPLEPIPMKSSPRK